MKVEVGQQTKQEAAQPIANGNKARVVVSYNPMRIREMLDKDGNVIDPRTKQIIRKAEDNK